MNIVNAGSRYMVYGEDVQTYKTLPPDTYKVAFSKMTGFSLVKHGDLIVKEKIYGSYGTKINKVLNTFTHLDRNMGIILSGPKGAGKSMFARQLAENGRDMNLPLIIVDTPYPGIEDFISSIQQECIVLFDEFEKTFKNDKDFNHQEGLLPLFDGIDNGKKLYVITCNEVNGLNNYFLNRPGRFHYHLMMTPPKREEVKEYMEDNLIGEARKYIDQIVNLSSISSFTYDVLRAVAFELNQGYTLNETMEDLNIERERFIRFSFTILFKNGIKVNTSEFCVDSLIPQEIVQWESVPKILMPEKFAPFCNDIRIGFWSEDVKINNSGYYIEPEKIRIDFDAHYNIEEKLKEELDQYKKSFEIENITINKFENYKSKKLWKYTV